MNTDYEFEMEEFDLPAEFEGEEELGRFRRPFTRSSSPRLTPRVNAPRPIVSRPRPRPVPPRRPPLRARRIYLYAPESPAANEYVRWVQTMLNQALNLQLPVDGVMSVETRSAIRSFQEKNGLPVTGIVGPDTERALIAAKDGQSSGADATKPTEPGTAAPAEPTPAEPRATTTEPELIESEWASEINRRNRDYIEWVQQSLNRIMGLRLAVDGDLGPQTRSAIRSFQQRAGLSVDGTVGSQTERALIAAGAIPISDSSGAQAPACEAAAHDLELLHDFLKWLGHELGKQTPHARRLGILRELVRLQVDDIIANLSDYIVAGCCEPSLKTMEGQMNALPWPVDSSAQAQRVRLVQAIKQAQVKARKDFQHC